MCASRARWAPWRSRPLALALTALNSPPSGHLRLLTILARFRGLRSFCSRYSLCGDARAPRLQPFRWAASALLAERVLAVSLGDRARASLVMARCAWSGGDNLRT